ncbi:glycosyltransferase family 4 protein [Aquimarina sp. RZ0]|uniref:glycosyltransferase family 4 protein n=1 Tax=Aquimarina sp. RZ0 TaxID=2607730 RepID=UPI0011F0AF3D|nr:glycosyltransferase family 4 protein [Aquimarina sp. RZ0]KAA1246948.1 glycosyltransferase family 4 protein [Aquimarina sp. RZ0]
MNGKIDFVINTLNGGGAERVMVIIANYLAEKNYDVSLITFNEGEIFQVTPKVKRVRLHNRQKRISNHTLRSIYNLKKYYKDKTKRPDVLISFTTTINLIAIIIAKLCNLKIIVSEHNNHLRNLTKKAKFTKEFIYKYTDILTVLTTYDIDYYKKHKTNVMVMPNPCTFKSITDPNISREPVLLAVGNLDRYHHKGFDNLITIVHPILKDNPDWKLKIIGGGKTDIIKELVNKNEINDQVEFVGFTNNVSDYMKSSEIFILSSRYEGLPMVLLEAMSQGMACVAYDCKTGPSDIINANVNGLLVEDQDINKMQVALRKLISDKELRNNLRNNSIKITEKYSLELIGNKWEEAISGILEK